MYLCWTYSECDATNDRCASVYKNSFISAGKFTSDDVDANVNVVGIGLVPHAGSDTYL